MIASLFAVMLAAVPTPAEMKGPFPILSTPYHADGSIEYEGLARGLDWCVRWGSPGMIWGQSNDAIDLLTDEEKARCFETLAAAAEGKPIVLTLGADGTNAAHVVKIATEIERAAARHPRAKIAMVSRPPDDVRSEADIEKAWDALAAVAKRPVIFQTYGTPETPTPSVELLVRLAKKHPDVFGYIKEEAAGNEANERMLAEGAARPAIKSVLAGWGGWQWLYQLRQCGCEGLVTERVAYLPLIMATWRARQAGDWSAATRAYAMYRLLIDQRNFPGGGLRDYSLYLLEKAGIFRNRVTRRYLKNKETEGGSFGVGHEWRLDTVEISPRQLKELDALYDEMIDFVKKGGN